MICPLKDVDVPNSESRYVAVLDVLGFKYALDTWGANELTRRYAAAINDSQTMLQAEIEHIYLHVPVESEPRRVRTKRFSEIEHVAVFSDSVFVFARSGSDESLRQLIKSTTALFRAFLRQELALAGTIAHGEAVVYPALQLYVGSAIVNAYLCAEQLNIVGVVLHRNVPAVPDIMTDPLQVALNPNKLCAAEPNTLLLRVPIVSQFDPLLSDFSGPWQPIVRGLAQRALCKGGNAAQKWLASNSILSAMLNETVTVTGT